MARTQAGDADRTRPDGSSAPAAAPVPRTFGAYLKNIGPGLVVALAWLGTGDFIDASVAGGNYGYSLLWALVIAVMARYITVSALARYQLCNAVGDKTILDGYRRLWRGFPLIIGASTVVLGFVYNAYMLLACGTALDHLLGGFLPLGRWGASFWALLTMLGAFWLGTRRKTYRGLEVTAQVTMAALVVCFIIALFGSGVDLPAVLEGLTFQMPSGEVGVLTALTATVALMGAVGGSAANLLYPYFILDRNWRGPEHRRMQQFDLRFAVGVLFGLVVAVWVVAAETLHGTGLTVASPDDLARMMELAVGPAGPYVLWVALFFVAFDNIPAQADVFARAFVDALRTAERDGAEDGAALAASERARPLFRVVQLGFLTVLPLVFSLPGGPNAVVLTVLGTAFSVTTIPIIIVGLLILTSSSELMPPAYRNRWWHVVLLGIVGVVGLWSTINLFGELIGMVMA